MALAGAQGFDLTSPGVVSVTGKRENKWQKKQTAGEEDMKERREREKKGNASRQLNGSNCSQLPFPRIAYLLYDWLVVDNLSKTTLKHFMIHHAMTENNQTKEFFPSSLFPFFPLLFFLALYFSLLQ